MFKINGKTMITWNVYVGCLFNCTYCNARKAALTRFKHAPRYRGGFIPHLVEEELRRRFKPGEFVFIAYMGDIAFATRREVELILSVVSNFPETTFLFLTKNPKCYLRWGLQYPENLYLGATIETDIDRGLTKAPAPVERYWGMKVLDYPRKFISIEPVMEFNLPVFLYWMKEIQPQIIEVGADNYHNHLIEPSWSKVEDLLSMLRDFCPTVIEKEGLERLKKEVYNEAE